MGFHEVRFPDKLSYGSRGGPGFSTAIVEVDSGAEQRVARWSDARRRYNVAYGVKSRKDLAELIEFYVARQGPAYGFRFKDFLDYASTDEGFVDAGASIVVTPTDEQLGFGDNSEKDFQLVKRYVSGPTTRVRNITKPVSGTVRVSLDDVEQVSGWTVDTTTGVVTFTTAPGSGVEVKAGFEFDVPVRFGEALDTKLAPALTAFDVGGLQDVPLVEIRDELSTPEEFYYGGSSTVTMDDDFTLSESMGRVIRIDPQANGLTVKLPTTSGRQQGAFYWVLENVGSYDVAVHDDSDVLLADLDAGENLEIVLDAVGWRALG